MLRFEMVHKSPKKPKSRSKLRPSVAPVRLKIAAASSTKIRTNAPPQLNSGGHTNKAFAGAVCFIASQPPCGLDSADNSVKPPESSMAGVRHENRNDFANLGG